MKKFVNKFFGDGYIFKLIVGRWIKNANKRIQDEEFYEEEELYHLK